MKHYYHRHLFICTNQKPNGKKCCQNMGSSNPDPNSSAQELLKYAKEKFAEEKYAIENYTMEKYATDQASQLANPPATPPDASAQNEVRINSSGCLGRCSEGPVIVVYPEGVWYRYQTNADIDEILKEHVIKGQIVERLKI